MKIETELGKDIINITIKIQMEYPELSKYINEMPVNISENDKDVINSRVMEEYYNSLVGLLAEYSKTHEAIKVKNTPKTLNFM